MSTNIRERSTKAPLRAALEATLADHRSHLAVCDVDDPAIDHHRRAADAIVSALDRLDRGTYGLCNSCGEPIPGQRLATVPEASTCLNCTMTTPRLLG